MHVNYRTSFEGGEIVLRTGTFRIHVIPGPFDTCRLVWENRYAYFWGVHMRDSVFSVVWCHTWILNAFLIDQQYIADNTVEILSPVRDEK